MSDQETKLRELARELQRKIEKAKPTYEQHERGELKVLNDQQQRHVDSYPGYVEDLAEVKAGRIPAPRAAAARQQPASKKGSAQAALPLVDGDGAAAADDDDGEPQPAKTGKQLKRERAAARKVAGKKGGREGSAESAVNASDANLSEHERFVLSVAKATGATRKALIDTFINGKVDRKRLQELEKEYDGVCQLRREILSGRIAQPTKVQQSKVQLAEVLKKDVEAEQAALRSQGDRHRILLMAEVEELEAQLAPPKPDTPEPESVPEAADAEDDEEEEAAPEPPAAEADDDKPEADDTDEAEEVAAAENAAAADDDEPAAAADDDAAESEKADEEEAKDEAEAPAAEEEAAEEEKRDPTPEPPREPTPEPPREPTPEPEREPTPEPPRTPTPPPPPKEIDWSEVVITKNRRQLAPPSKRASSPAVAAAASASANDSAAAKPRSASPGPRSPVEAAPRPTTMPSLCFTADDAPAASGSSPKKGGAKKGAKGGGAAASSSASAFRQSAASRLQREFQEITAADDNDGLGNVACALVEDSLFRWAVNVAVADGPLVGLVVPLELQFSDFYPQEPPLVRALHDIPHPSIVPTASSRNTLCMEHTAAINPRDVSPTRGWSPAYGAFSVLSQLQGFFAAENFKKLEKSLGAKIFAGRIRSARIAISNHSNASLGATPSRPVPAVPMVNGPMRHAPEAMLLREGAICCRAAGEGNSWRHAYAKDGTHQFRMTLRRGSAVVGITANGDREDLSQLGKTDNSWALNTSSGSLWASGTETKRGDDDADAFPLPKGSTIDVVVTPADGKIVFSIHGGKIKREIDAGANALFVPAYCLLSAQSAAEIAFYVGGAAVPAPSTGAAPAAAADDSTTAAGEEGTPLSNQSPVASGPATLSLAPALKQMPRCAVTLKTPADGALVCLGIEVSKRHRTHLPAEIHTTGSYVSLEAFPKVSAQRAPSGYRYDFALPLLLDAAHSKHAFPELKRVITRMCRNPLASTLYDPPFRPELACGVFAELLRGVVRDVLHSKAPDYGEALVRYCRLVHGFAALAVESAAIVKEAQATIAMGECSSTVVFAVSTVVMDEPWPEIVKQALRAELAGREPASDEEGFALLKRALPKLLVGGAMAKCVRFASLSRAVEVLAAGCGGPSDEIANEVLSAIATRTSITSWEAMCDFFGVSTSVSDVIGEL